MSNKVYTTCVRCQKYPPDTKSGRYCASCRAKVIKENAAKARGRVNASGPRVCSDCGVEIGTRHDSRCYPCRKAYDAQNGAQDAARKESAAREVRSQSNAVARMTDDQQRAFDRMVLDRMSARCGYGNSAVRKLTAEEVAAVQHTITPIDQIKGRSFGDPNDSIGIRY